jgi:peptide/nickel transport system substrate-binding protein
MLSKFHKIFDAMTAVERQIFQGAVLFFFLSLTLNAANAFYEKTVVTPIQGGSYTEGIIGQPIAINPLIAGSNDADRDLIEITFAGLLDLAESYKESDGGKTWTVELKEDIRWSDGEPITADDVIFTLETIKNPDAHSALFATWQGVSTERLGERTIRFTIRAPYAFFSDNLRSLKIVPRHIFGSIPAANLRLSDYNLEPVGSGPYAFSGYEKRKDGFIGTYRFTRNPNYAGEEALIEDFRVAFFQNYDDAIQAFNRRDIDGLGGIAPRDLSKIKIGHQEKEIQIPRYYALFLNPTTAIALKQEEVRDALTRATNRERLVGEVLNGHGIPVEGPIYPSIEGFTPHLLGETPFSIEVAAEILDKGGWSIGDSGVRTKKISQNNVTLSFEIVVPDIDFLVSALNIIAEDWAKIGVHVTPVVLPPAEVSGDVIRARNYQMILFGNILKNNPDVFSFWHSSERFRPGLNLSLYENKKVDDLLDVIRKDFNTESRVVNIKKLQTIITDEAPAVFLFSPNYLYITTKSLGGFDDTLIDNPSDRFGAMNTWYLKTARTLK